MNLKKMTFKKGNKFGIKNSPFIKGHKINLGRKHTEETRRKYSISKTGDLNPAKRPEVRGYWVDGYCKQRNIVFEVDEKPKNKKKDIERENIIKKELNCSFIRIPTYKKEEYIMFP